MTRTPAVMVGQGVGDSLGMPFESIDGVHQGISGWQGELLAGTHHKLPAGHWTDDTEMAIELAETLIEGGRLPYNPTIAARRYLAWSKGTPHGMGGTTRKAMIALERGMSWNESGVRFAHGDAEKVGNGTAMRVAPLGLWINSSTPNGWAFLQEYASIDSQITHVHDDAKIASIVIAHVVSCCVNGWISGRDLMDLALATASAFPMTLVQQKLRLVSIEGNRASPEKVIAGLELMRGNAANTVASAIYCASYYSSDFKKGVIAAVRSGGDTDTRAAITGAILGANLGLEAIPQEYKDGVLEYDRLLELDKTLTNLRWG